MPYQRAFSTLGYPEGTIDEVIALAEKHRLDAVELRALGGTIDLPAYFDSTAGSPAALAGKLRTARIRIVSLDTSLHLMAGTEAERAKFLEFLPWAEALGVRWLRVFDGGKTADATELAEAAGTVRWWRELRRANGWRADLMVETHDSLTTAAAIRRFAAAAPATAILWDAFNTWIKSGEDPVETWRAIGPDVVQVHVKDAVRVPSGRHPFTYVLPGTGEFPMARLAAELRAGFSGTVSLEWEKLWHPYLAPLDDALTSAAERGWW
jgi:sugar phosphate isomerase/epimerase